MKNDLTNDVVGTFKGPGKTGAKHIVQFTKEVNAKYLSFQLKKKKAILQIKEIKLNEKPVIGTYKKACQWWLLRRQEKHDLIDQLTF